MPPRVTVVVPNYNHARFLAQRLDSILNQTYRDFELLYLDDASTDESADVFAGYADDPRVRALVNAQNTGSPFVQWNRGVREARGEYVWLAEADDWADENLLATLVERLDTHPEAGVAYCESYSVDENGAVTGRSREWMTEMDTRHWQSDYVANGLEECRRYMALGTTIPNASAAVFRKRVYEEAGGADESLRMCGDWLMWTKMLLSADVAYVAVPLNYFRIHSRSVTQKSSKNGIYAQERYQVLRYIRQTVPILPAIMNRACHAALMRWMDVMMKLPWRQNVSLYRLAREVDPRLAARLPEQIWGRIRQRLRNVFRRGNTLVPMKSDA